MKILILGDSGLLGQALVQRFARGPKAKVYGISTSPKAVKLSGCRPVGRYVHIHLDVLTHQKAIKKLLLSEKPDLVINSIALADIGDCEAYPELAEVYNVQLPVLLSSISGDSGSYFIQISSDQVFDGRKRKPLREIDAPHPLNFYGKTKVMCEQRILETNPRALLARTNIVGYRGWKKSLTFVEWLEDASVNKKKIVLFDDYITSSIHVRLFADALAKAFEKRLKGICHIGSHDAASKFEFAMLICKRLGLEIPRFRKASMRKSNLVPSRPAYLELNVGKFERATGMLLPSIAETVDCLAEDFNSRQRR